MAEITVDKQDIFNEGCALIAEQLGQDVVISLATCVHNAPSVRMVDAYYEDGAVYVLTHTASLKMKQAAENPNVAFCRGLLQGFGTAVNLGHPTDAQNGELAEKLRQVFAGFYSQHVDEGDPGTCILKIELTTVAVFGEASKYVIDFVGRNANKWDFENDSIPAG